MTAQPPNPELKEHLGKQIRISLNKNREISGILVGYDHFMNLTIRNARIEAPKGSSPLMVPSVVIRGATVLSFEAVN